MQNKGFNRRFSFSHTQMGCFIYDVFDYDLDIYTYLYIFP